MENIKNILISICIKLFQFLYNKSLCKIAMIYLLKVLFWETDFFLPFLSWKYVTGCSLHLRGEIARCKIVYCFIDCGQWFGWMVRDLEGTWLQNCWDRNLGKKNVSRPLWMSKKLDITVSHVSVHQRVTSRGQLW